MPTQGAPSSRVLASFSCELATVTDINRTTWTCSVQTTHTSRTATGVPWLAPYHHYTGGEGYHCMPEVGASCYIAAANDGTPVFILGFISPPAAINSTGANGAATDVGYQGNRPDLSPGDIALTTRDGNFLILRRGGVVQLGATPMAQRMYVPIRNFIHDFAENYQLATPAGDVTWIVDRPELDAAGKAPCSWTMHLQEFATDKQATVRVRYLPLAASGAQKAAWEVVVAPQHIDRDTGKVTSPVYTMLVLTDGTTTEMVGASRTIEVKGDDALKVKGDQTTEVGGDSRLEARNVTLEASIEAGLYGKVVRLADPNAIEPGICGNRFLQWLSTVQIIVPTGTGVISPASIAQFQSVLSTKVFLK